MKLSIIVPVYNVAPYVVRCLESLRFPSDNYEVVVVNDGSTDDTLQQVQQFDWKDTRHQIVTRENHGAAYARNVGLQCAVGDYVWFVDGDDWIEIQSIELIIKHLADIDILAFASYFYVSSDNRAIHSIENIPNTGRELSFCDYFHGPPFYVFRRAYLAQNGLSFKEGIYYEDTHFIPRALYKAGAIGVFDQPVYCYFHREGSLTKSVLREKHVDDLITIINELSEFMHKEVLTEDQKLWGRSISHNINTLAFFVCRSDDKVLQGKVRKFFRESPATSLLRTSSNKWNRLWFWISKLLGNSYFTVYQLLYKIRYR